MKKAFYVLLAISLCLFVLNQFQVINVYEYVNALTQKIPLISQNLHNFMEHINAYITTIANVFTTWDVDKSFFANIGDKFSGLIIEPWTLNVEMIKDIYNTIVAIFDAIGLIISGGNA